VAKWLAATHADPLREIQKSVNATLAIASPGHESFSSRPTPPSSDNVIETHEHRGEFKKW
jgi:hypothetical protein